MAAISDLCSSHLTKLETALPWLLILFLSPAVMALAAPSAQAEGVCGAAELRLCCEAEPALIAKPSKQRQQP